MAFLRLSKKEFDYVLKVEREDYWKKKLDALEKEVNSLPIGSTEREDKEEELKEFRDTANKALSKILATGPTVWKLRSISEREVDNILSTIKRSLGKMTGKSRKEFTTDQLSYARTMAREICKRGIVGWENLKDHDTNQLIEFSPELIEELPHDITSELSNIISGNIEEEEERNLS